MNAFKRKLIAFLLLTVILSAYPFHASAAGPIDPAQDVSVVFSYIDGSKPIPNARFNLFKVADVDEFARMTLTSSFEAYSSSVAGLSDFENMDHDKWLQLASTLKAYVQRDGLSPESGSQTDANGLLSLTAKPGLYLVIGYRATTDDFYTYTATPFMLFLPAEDLTNNEWNYAVSASPKFEKDYNPDDDPGDDPVITRKALKIWDDAGYESLRPKQATVQLLCDGSVYDTQILNDLNNWRYAWDNLDSAHDWTLVETELPGYAVSIVRNGITFSVTNKYVEPVTGGNPPVQKIIAGDTPKTDASFIFTMTAKDTSFPMPEGSKDGVKEIIITGAGSKEFGEMTFTKPGTYVYTVSEKNVGTKGYTYDTTVYTVTFNVTLKDGVLSAVRTIVDGNGRLSSGLKFTNSYKKLPQTGLLWWPVPLLLLGGCAFLSAGIIRRKKYNK